ncbi:MAG: amidohydrolase family protein [Verrucomicrobiota bacterium]
MTTFRSRIVYPVSAPPIEGGMVGIEQGKISAVGKWDGREATDLGDVILMPGLINAHCHLDYSVMRGAIFPNTSFSQWIRRINELKRTLSDDDYLESIRNGFDELLRHGTTSVFNIESFPELMVRMPPPPIRTWWFYEMMDVRNRIHTEDVVAGALSFFEDRADWPGGFGLSPHAPYTTSPDLYRLVRFCCEKYGMPFMTHLAESDEEFEMFRKARGPLHDFLKDLGRKRSDTGTLTPVARLLAENALPDGSLLTHMNFLEEEDWGLLRGKNFSVIHCPCCHEYFDRGPFPLERFLREGFNVCLGTDSLASNRSLNMFAEMQCAARRHPGISPATFLEMATLNPAKAIGMGGRLGAISANAEVDLIAVPYSGPVENFGEAILAHPGPVDWVMVGGCPSFQRSVEN